MDVYRFIRNWAARIFICSVRGHVSGREKYGRFDDYRCATCRLVEVR